MAQPSPAQSFIGSRISLTSMNDIRYRGTLQAINHLESTIQLVNVVSMGTENRRPQAEYLPPNETVFANIIFRATEVKDLALETGPPAVPPSLPQDPAIIGASRAAPPSYPFQYDSTTQHTLQHQHPHVSQAPPVPTNQRYKNPAGLETNGSTPHPVPSPLPRQPQVPQTELPAHYPSQNTSTMSSAVSSVSATLEKVERSLGDLRVSSRPENQIEQHHHHARSHREHRKGQRNGPGSSGVETKSTEVRMPPPDFDFQKANARFDKAAVIRQQQQYNDAVPSDDENTNPSDVEGERQKLKEKEKDKEKDKFYNPTRSFFDNISSDAKNAQQRSVGGRGRGGRGGSGGDVHNPRGGGRRGGYGRSRREEERDRNVATFGEPGDLGPGAYVHNRWSRRRGRGAPTTNAPPRVTS